MPVRKKYSNATFTKRVDHEGGRHRPLRTMSEPGACKECGAVFARRRWTAGGSTSIKRQHEELRPVQMTLCPACKQQRKGEPHGFVFLDGDFFSSHGEEIEKLLRNEAKRAAEDNPLARIMEFKRGDGHQLTVSTTTEHLAQRLGHAVEKAFGSRVHYDFSHENKLARVTWRRD